MAELALEGPFSGVGAVVADLHGWKLKKRREMGQLGSPGISSDSLKNIVEISILNQVLHLNKN